MKKDKATILVVEDEASQRLAVTGFLRKLGYQVLESENGSEAIDMIKVNPIDIIISDIRMPGKSGVELLKEVKESNPDVAFILMTAFSSVNDAVDAMKEGAFNYLTKPLDLDTLEINISKALENRRLITENRRLKEMLDQTENAGGIISESSEMEEVLNLVARVAPSSATVLIFGESGTGKERIARAIHYSSPRSEKPFIAVNCAAIPETLLESEMFGHEKGAFTGAETAKAGKIEEADGGTLFIDEVGDMPLSLQPKLLRFLQEGTFERLGSTKSVKPDIRIIAATHKDLKDMINKGSFREDLFYRLSVININIPALRERRADIIPLAEHFIKIYTQKNSKNVRGMTSAAKDIILKYNYPGNIRELENALEAAVVLTRNEAIDISDLPIAFQTDKDSPAQNEDESLPAKLEAIEKRAILETLRKTGNNKSEAARLLGISEKNIRDRLKKWKYK